jgi:hypothetical protein
MLKDKMLKDVVEEEDDCHDYSRSSTLNFGVLIGSGALVLV